MTLNDIKHRLVERLTDKMSSAGIMFRLFGRAKSIASLEHKMRIKGEKYRSGKGKIQDMIGLRIVLYFPEDVDLVAFFFSYKNLVDSAIDVLDDTTFRPQRLNLVMRIPDDMVADFRACLPEAYAPYLDDTFELQIRTVFSEGWHEVEHDLRYKCKEDWEGCGTYSRALNGIIASLETAEWSMSSIFREMSQQNMKEHNYRAMLRNKLHIRFRDEDFSAPVAAYLQQHDEVGVEVFNIDRLVFLLTLLNHTQHVPLTFDNVLFLINRIDLQDEGLLRLEDAETRAMIDSFIAS